MIQNIRRLTLIIAVAATTGITVGCSSGEEETNSPVTVVDLLRTDAESDNQEGWACIDQAGEASVYTFYDKGDVEGMEQLRLGSEYSIRSTIPPFHYAWSAIDNASIALQSGPLGVQDVWTNIEFSSGESPERLMRAVSNAKGDLLCSLQGQRS